MTFEEARRQSEGLTEREVETDTILKTSFWQKRKSKHDVKLAGTK